MSLLDNLTIVVLIAALLHSHVSAEVYLCHYGRMSTRQHNNASDTCLKAAFSRSYDS